VCNVRRDQVHLYLDECARRGGKENRTLSEEGRGDGDDVGVDVGGETPSCNRVYAHLRL
jgi:hypothetical protein